MTVVVSSIVDHEIVINEKVDDQLYDYINNIVNKYSLMPLKITISIFVDDYNIEVKVYDNTDIDDVSSTKQSKRYHGFSLRIIDIMVSEY